MARDADRRPRGVSKASMCVDKSNGNNSPIVVIGSGNNSKVLEFAQNVANYQIESV